MSQIHCSSREASCCWQRQFQSAPTPPVLLDNSVVMQEGLANKKTIQNLSAKKNLTGLIQEADGVYELRRALGPRNLLAVGGQDTNPD